MSHPESRIPPRPSHAPPPPPTRRPGPRAVLWGSLSLFAVLFALLTFQLSASASPASTGSQHPSVAARKAAATEVAETTATEAEAPVEAEAEIRPGGRRSRSRSGRTRSPGSRSGRRRRNRTRRHQLLLTMAPHRTEP